MSSVKYFGLLAFRLPIIVSNGIRNRNGLPVIATRGLVATVRHQSKKDKPISDTSIMVQDGTTIHEMPSIVQIVNGDFQVHHGGKTATGKFEGMGLESHHTPKTIFKGIDTEEETEMISGFKRCSSAHEIFQLLDVCPQCEVTPSVAVTVMRRIFDFENSSQFVSNGSAEEPQFTFTRNALMKQLIENICGSSQPTVVIEALRVISRDTNKDRLSYMEVLATESIIQVTDGKFNINEACDIIRAFRNLGTFGNSYIDKVWIGINEKQKYINVEELCNIVSVLPMLRTSRKYLYNIVDRMFPLVYHKLEPENVIRICQVLVELKESSSRLLSLISRWTALNIHSLTEGNLRWIVYSLMTLHYTDDNIQQALSRYMKIKRLKINDSSLVAVALDYCERLRIRHPIILNAASEYYVVHGNQLSTSQIASFIRTYGSLNYTPKNTFNFFQTLESQLETKFSDFEPMEILDIFLSCIYLERYPLNFVNNVFNHYFFDKIRKLEYEELERGRKKLKVIDTALTIEAKNYLGPKLSKDFHQQFWKDERIKRCITGLTGTLIEVAGSSERIIMQSALLPDLAPIRLYLVDFIVDMYGRNNVIDGSLWPANLFALIIHLPEHYDITGSVLCGAQSMKIRHLQLLNYYVVPLNYAKISKLFVFPDLLKEYVEKQMKKSAKMEPY